MDMAKAKKGKSGGGGGGGRPTEMLLVASKVKQMLKDAGCNTAGDALDGLNNLVGWYVQQAAKRASENGRKTVRAHDFSIM
jgi:histone H3/H4